MRYAMLALGKVAPDVFTRRHYQFVAEVVGRTFDYSDEHAYQQTMRAFKDAFKADNPRFDGERFDRAAMTVRTGRFGRFHGAGEFDAFHRK